MTQIVKKTWQELTPVQQQEATKQMQYAGWRNAKQYSTYTYQVKMDGGIHGWIDPHFNFDGTRRN